MELLLTDDERELLVQVLEERQTHFLHEIAKTDHHHFKQALKKRCETLEKLLEKLQAHAVAML